MWGGGRPTSAGVQYVPKHAAARAPAPAPTAPTQHQKSAAATAQQQQPIDPTALIPGLRIIPNFITTEEEEQLLSMINDQAWDETLKRKTQQYGYKFEHQSQQVRAYLGPLPGWLHAVTNRLVEKGLYPQAPDQVIINQYTPGQGINPHVDKAHCFDGVVGSVGLGSSCIMQFRHAETPYECIDVWFPRRMVVVLTGASRYSWTHGIQPHTEDRWQGALHRRKTRVSVTWRTVIGPYAKSANAISASPSASAPLPPPAAAMPPPAAASNIDGDGDY